MRKLIIMPRAALIAAFLIAAITPAAAETAKEQYDYLHAKCGPALQMSASECDCIVATAKSTLDKTELDMAVLFAKQDQEGITKMQSQLTGAQMTNAMAFVTDAPKKCRNK